MKPTYTILMDGSPYQFKDFISKNVADTYRNVLEANFPKNIWTVAADYSKIVSKHQSDINQALWDTYNKDKMPADEDLQPIAENRKYYCIIWNNHLYCNTIWNDYEQGMLFISERGIKNAYLQEMDIKLTYSEN